MTEHRQNFSGQGSNNHAKRGVVTRTYRAKESTQRALGASTTTPTGQTNTQRPANHTSNTSSAPRVGHLKAHKKSTHVHGRPRSNTQSTSREREASKKQIIPSIETGVLRVIPIGGVEEVGRNMTALEFGNDIIIVDAGIQFPESDHPGVDYIIPNTKYLEDNISKIRGLFITHGHLDHIGAVPYLIKKIGNPKIYSREFGAVMIAKRHEEFPQLPKLNMHLVENGEVIRAGENFVIETFPISHTIPDSMGLIIKTPVGEIVFIEDVRVDNINGVPTEEEFQQYSRFKDKEYLLLTMDSTSIEKRGFSLSEQVVVKNIIEIIKNVSGRMIIASFASQVERIVAIVNAAEAMGKKVVMEGRSMKTNMEIAKQLGILKAQNIVSVTEMANYPPSKILILATGSQGEEFAALARMANKSHKQVTLTESDTILLSSSIIPGNEGDISKLKDNLYRSDAKIITYLDSDVHASGHGNREELKWIHQQIKYRFFMPVHGNHYMLKQHAEMSQTLGTPKENTIVPDNGSIIEFFDGGKSVRVRKEKAPAFDVTVDGFNVGDTQEYVIRDRKMLAQDGMFVAIVTIDSSTGKLRKSPDLISRGFVYLKENQELLRNVRGLIKKSVETNTEGQHPINFDMVKGAMGDAVAKYLYQKTNKQPLVIPVLLSV